MPRVFEITPAFICDVWLQRAAVVAGYALLVYDYLLTLSDEVEYIWKAPWTPVKTIYLANRYIALLGQTFVCIQATGFVAAATGGCQVYAIFLAIYLLVSLETAHVLVVVRAWAIWGGNRRILQSVVLGYVACVVSLFLAVGRRQEFSNYEPIMKFVCYEPAPERAWLFYFGSLVVDSLLFCMTMVGLWSYRKSFKYGSLELIKALMKGVTSFYIINVFYDALGIVSLTRYANSPRSFAITTIITPVLAIYSQRVAHDLRRVAPMSWSAPELSQVVNRQLAAFPCCANGADEGASMVLATSSGVEREPSLNIDETGMAADDNGDSGLTTVWGSR